MRGWINAAAVGAFVAVFAIACAHNKPPAPPPLNSAVASCPAIDPMPTAADSCDGKFTPEGLACFNCNVQSACLFVAAGVYCTPSCRDSYCGKQP